MHPLFLSLLALLLAAGDLRANAYDTVARMLAPMLNPFLEKPGRPEVAIRGTLVLESAKADALEGTSPGPVELRFAVERPDRLRIEGSLAGMRVTVCRTGETLWADPGEGIRELLAGLPPAREPREPLGPMRLPVNDVQAVFLPALLTVRELERSVFQGQPCRVLDLGLMPELAEAAGADAWSARVWVREADLRPARIGVRGPGFTGVARVERLEYLRQLPPETWARPETAVPVSLGRFQQLSQALIARARAERRSGTPPRPAP